MLKLLQSFLWRCLSGLCLGLALSAQAAQDPASEPELVTLTRRWLDGAVAGATAQAGVPLRLEVVVGALDGRLRLAPCARVEPYLPPGARLWGKTRVGLRCSEGPARWNVFLPVTVKAFGPAWVVRSDLPAGAVLSEADLMQAEVDWAEAPSPVMAQPQQWVGQVAVRALATGWTLRQNMVRPATVFQAGTQVRVVAQGVGFQITADGQALSAGVIGQLARVRMDNGRIMSGTVLDARTVGLEM